MRCCTDLTGLSLQYSYSTWICYMVEQCSAYMQEDLHHPEGSRFVQQIPKTVGEVIKLVLVQFKMNPSYTLCAQQ